jgi:C1A family cysteine protease
MDVRQMPVALSDLGMGSKDESAMMGMGYLPELADIRDLNIKSKGIAKILESTGVLKAAPSIPASVDIKQYCSPIENQLNLGSCTANAGVGLLEYFERKSFGKHIDASRLFLYKATRDLMQVTGDTGAYIRTTLGAIALFGVPPEKYWPYDITKFDIEPSAFLYAFAEDFKGLQYYRLDPPGATPASVLATIKSWIASGFPSEFGFTVYSSISQAATTGQIPFPCAGEKVLGGHAIDAVGYDDNMKIKNTNCNLVTTGAFLIRNSWGTGWGAAGYGWLPYDYVLKGLANDWWTLVKADWIDTGQFGISSA